MVWNTMKAFLKHENDGILIYDVIMTSKMPFSALSDWKSLIWDFSDCQCELWYYFHTLPRGKSGLKNHGGIFKTWKLRHLDIWRHNDVKNVIFGYSWLKIAYLRFFRLSMWPLILIPYFTPGEKLFETPLRHFWNMKITSSWYMTS